MKINKKYLLFVPAVFFAASSAPSFASDACSWDSLELAIMADDVAEVSNAASACPGVASLTNNSGETLLFSAVRYESMNSAAKLLSLGFSPNARDAYGCSALCKATSVEMADLLLKNGARVDFKDRLGATPLHHLLPTKNWALFEHLLAAGARVEVKDIAWASNHYHADLLEFLADRAHQRQIAGSGQYFNTFFLYEDNYQRIAKTLIEKGADLNNTRLIRSQRTLLDAYVHDYLNDHAFYKKHGLKAIRFLLENGADPNGNSPRSGKPVLFAALTFKVSEPQVAKEILSLFLAHGYHRDLRNELFDGKTLLMDVASLTLRGPAHESFVQEMVPMLVANGFSPDAQGHDGRTALHWAIRWANPIAGAYLASVTDLSLQDRDGLTAEAYLKQRVEELRSAPEEKAKLARILQAIRAAKN